jgi:hypothetical protein
MSSVHRPNNETSVIDFITNIPSISTFAYYYDSVCCLDCNRVVCCFFCSRTIFYVTDVFIIKHTLIFIPLNIAMFLLFQHDLAYFPSQSCLAFQLLSCVMFNYQAV